MNRFQKRKLEKLNRKYLPKQIKKLNSISDESLNSFLSQFKEEMSNGQETKVTSSPTDSPS